MVWNNGDGTDSNDGDGGNDEVVVNGAPTQNDMFTAAPGAEPGRVLFERTNLNTFSIDLSAERLTVNGLGGNDQFGNDGVVPPGLAGPHQPDPERRLRGRLPHRRRRRRRRQRWRRQ